MKIKPHTLFYIVADFFAASLAWVIFFFSRKIILQEAFFGISITLLYGTLTVASIWILLYTISGAYLEIIRKSRLKEFFNQTGISLLGCLLIFFLFLLDDEGIHDYHNYYITLGVYFLIHWFIASISKMLVMTHTKKSIEKGQIFFKTLVIGCQQNAFEIVEEITKNNQYLGFKFIAYTSVIEPFTDLLKSKKLKYLGTISNIEKIIRRCHIEHVVIAIEPSEKHKISDILNQIEGYPVRISILPDLYQNLWASVTINHVYGVPLIEIEQKIMPLWQQAIKRGLDILVSFMVLFFGFPFFLFFAIMTKLSSKGPIFFKQERIGKHGIPFKIFKFRSMVQNAEKAGPALSKDKDPRITKWGKIMRKTRIDELPQFYNVLIGDMSLVGPRPERQYFIDQIIQQSPHYKNLHKVRPGITSLGQVKYGYAESVEQMLQRLRYDIIYIENMSIIMDLRILIFTVLTVIKAKGK